MITRDAARPRIRVGSDRENGELAQLLVSARLGLRRLRWFSASASRLAPEEIGSALTAGF
jgi:hypothetical protein